MEYVMNDEEYAKKVKSLLIRDWRMDGDSWYAMADGYHDPYTFEQACKEEGL